MDPDERVSEGLPQKPFRKESALETRGQWYKITTVPWAWPSKRGVSKDERRSQLHPTHLLQASTPEACWSWEREEVVTWNGARLEDFLGEQDQKEKKKREKKNHNTSWIFIPGWKLMSPESKLEVWFSFLYTILQNQLGVLLSTLWPWRSSFFGSAKKMLHKGLAPWPSS